jgi:hypothetical protein
MTTSTRPPGGLLPIRFTAPARGLLGAAGVVPLRLAFGYDPTRPYEVTISISQTGQYPTSWCVSRETVLLAALYDIASGDGDFQAQQVQPAHAVSVGPSLRMRFCSDHPGSTPEERSPYHIDVSICEIERGLRRILRAVPLGDESRHMDMDYQISQLLGHTAGGH